MTWIIMTGDAKTIESISGPFATEEAAKAWAASNEPHKESIAVNTVTSEFETPFPENDLELVITVTVNTPKQ